jgi:hypothetical protein
LISRKLWTSYWSNPDLRHTDAVKVSISRGDWKGARFRYRKAWPLAPSRETWGFRGDAEGFTASYLGQLETRGVSEIRDLLQRISDEEGGRDLIPLCHERDPAECHRSLFASWWREQTEQEVPELGDAETRLF